MKAQAWKHAATIALLIGMVGCNSGPRWDFWKVGKADQESNAELAEADLGPQFDSARPSQAATPGESAFAAVPPGSNPSAALADARAAGGWASEYDPSVFPGAGPSTAPDVNNPYTQAIAGANAMGAPSTSGGYATTASTTNAQTGAYGGGMNVASAPAAQAYPTAGAAATEWSDPENFSGGTSYDFGAGAAASAGAAAAPAPAAVNYDFAATPPASAPAATPIAADNPFLTDVTTAADPVAQAAATYPAAGGASGYPAPASAYTQQSQATPAAPAYVSGGTPGQTGYQPGVLPNPPGSGTNEPPAAVMYAETAPTPQRVDDAYRPGSTAFGDPTAWGGATFTAQNQPGYPQPNPVEGGYPTPTQGGSFVR